MQERKDKDPLIYSYLKKYQENPRSRVFAPLAEAYRKAGLVDEAIEISREGLQYHPRFVGGRVALSRALFDKKDFQGVIEELKEIIQEVPDNLVAQRLFAESCLMMGRVAEALSSFKMLLYFHPEDHEIAQLVTELETQVYRDGAVVMQEPSAAKENNTNNINKFKVFRAGVGEPPVQGRHEWMQRIEVLQSLLQRVERYRLGSSAHLSSSNANPND